MDPLLHAISWVSATAAGALFSAIWEGVVLAACVALCLRLLPGLSAAARSVVWANVFLLLVLLQLLPSVAEHWSTGGGFHPSPFHLDPLWSVAIAGLWAMLSIWRGGQLILGALVSIRLAGRATPVRASAQLQRLLQAAGEGRRGRAAELCISGELERPCVFGFFHPRILLPAALYEQLTDAELEQVALHEMEHLRRGDDWTNLAQKAALVLFPLNPALLWVERRLCAERELACDDRVLRSTGARKAYAVCLTRLAEYSMLRRGLSLALGAWERRPELVRRIHRILRSPQNPIGGRRAELLTGGLICVVMIVAAALARSPQLVSFAPPAQRSLEARSMSAPAIQAIDTPEFNGSPMLVKAVMPSRQLQSPHRRESPRIAAPRMVRQPRPLPTRRADYVVLTEWEEVGPPQQQVFAVAQDHRSSYAAVAFADGWLIIQI